MKGKGRHNDRQQTIRDVLQRQPAQGLEEEEKRAHRDAQFPVDLANARALGKRLVEKAKAL